MMLSVTRKSKIKEILLEKKSVTVSELAPFFAVTEETIRRDLKQLEGEGFLTRTYGGAFIQDGVENNVDLKIRETAYTSSKNIIAQKCLPLIHNGDSIFLDESTTALHVARAIRSMRLTVMTNSLMILNDLKDCESLKLNLIGGFFSPKSETFIGQETLRVLDQYYFDKAFLSCRSLSLEYGVTDSTEFTAALRRKVIERSNMAYLIADVSKFNKVSFIHICDLKALTGIVTDWEMTPEWKDAAARADVLCLDAAE